MEAKRLFYAQDVGDHIRHVRFLVSHCRDSKFSHHKTNKKRTKSKLRTSFHCCYIRAMIAHFVYSARTQIELFNVLFTTTK